MDDKPESYILIVFEGINSVNIKTMTTDGVSPMQLMAISDYLNVLAKNELVMQINDRLEIARQQQLSVPKQGLIIPGGR
jgi:hypothetical protein